MRYICIELFFRIFVVGTFSCLYIFNNFIKKNKKYTLSSFTRRRWGTVLIPWAHTAWLSLGSSRTSEVPIVFWANEMTDLMAHGARFLNERPCTSLCRWMVYSRATTSWSAERVLPPLTYNDMLVSLSVYLIWWMNLFLFWLHELLMRCVLMLFTMDLGRTMTWGCWCRWAKGWALFGLALLCKQSKVQWLASISGIAAA